MVSPTAYDPHLLEREVESFWKARRLPPVSGILGPPDGAVVRQFEGTFTPGESPELVAERAVAADADARFLSLVGRRASATLRWEGGPSDEVAATVGPVLRALGIWVGGSGLDPWDAESRRDQVEGMVGRLARAGILVARDVPLRFCPVCEAPRSPETIVYQEEEADTFLIRFDLPTDGSVAHALVWVDAPWRLLGTTALLVHPELPYVLAKYRRRDTEELVFTSRSSLGRFRTWLPDATFEVVEERRGQEYAGRSYLFPLRNEFPTGGGLSPPAGTVIAVTDVSDTGTGVVPLVPGHGAADASVAESHGIMGWPLVTRKGRLDVTLVHKYAGLDLATASEFIVRDLTDSGAVFAHLRVRRGVPHCVLCGTPILWMPGRAWCLEPGRLPAERIELYRRTLPTAPALPQVEVAPWPVSEADLTEEPAGIALLECARCERLDALDGSPTCPCGGKRYPARRLLLPAVRGTLSAWARTDPFPPDDTTRVYLAERRRVPRLVHHLTGMTAARGTVPNSQVTQLATIPEVDLAALIQANGADAVRSAFVRTERAPAAAANFSERCVQDRGRLARLWAFTEEVRLLCDAAMVSSFAQPIAGFLSELELEDRAILARWERTRTLVRGVYDRFDPAAAYRRLFRFLETDLDEYREWTRSRVTGDQEASRRAVLRTLSHILRGAAALLAPITPYFSEAVHRRFGSRLSLFESTWAATDRDLVNDELAVAWDRWRSVVTAVERFRRERRIAPGTSIPAAALVVSTDDLGDKLRQDQSALTRLAGLGRLDVGSPRQSWAGRQRRLVPIEPEVQRVYGADASQILHLLRRLPIRRPDEGTPGEVSVVIRGVSLQIPASIVEFRDELPERTVPVPWGLGEMYLELPPGGSSRSEGPPPLTPDAFWLARRLERRLRREGSSEGLPRPAAVVTASDPLASELRSVSEPLAHYLGLKELRVVVEAPATPPSHGISGRTRTGARWWVYLSGAPPARRRVKHRSPRPRRKRVSPERAPSAAPAPEVDYADPSVVEREESVRALNGELDELLGAPVIGPTKVRVAWGQGLRSLDDFRDAPFETVAELPGFGHALAATLVRRLGGSVPATPARSHRAARPPRPLAGPRWEPEASGAAVPVTVPKPPVPLEEVAPRSTAPASPAPLAPPATVSTSAGGAEAPSEPPSEAPMEPTLEPVLDSAVAPAAEPMAPQPPGESPTPPPEALPAEFLPERGEESATRQLPPAEEVPQELPPAPAEMRPPEPAPVPSAEIGPEPLRAELASELAAPPEGGEPSGEGAAAEVPAKEVPVEGRLAEQAEVGAEAGTGPEAAAPAVAGELILPPEPPSPTGPTASSPETPAETPLEVTGEGAETLDSAEKGEAAPTAPTPSGGTVETTEEIRSAETEVGPSETEATPAVAETLPSAEVGPPPSLPTTPAEERALETEAGIPPVEPRAAPLEETSPPVEALPPPEEVVPPPPEPPRGGVDLTVGSSVVASLLPFLDAAAAGLKGICIVRESPERIAAQVGGRPVDIYWLSNLGRKQSLKPNDLAGISQFLTRQLMEEKVPIFFLEGIEYLVRIHGVDPTLERLMEFGRMAEEQEARVWIHVTPDLLRPSDLERIREAFPHSGGFS